MNRSTGDTLQTLKNRSFDENSKKTEKRLSLEHKRKSKQFLPVKPMDMKPVKVLVERTKFNEMHVLDHSRSSSKPSPLVNGSLEKKHSRKPGSKSKKSEKKKVLPHKTNIDGLFRVRRCYVKIPKDKVLIRQLAKFGSSQRPQKRPRGRPKKARRRSKAETELSPTSANTSDLKRKTTSDGEEGSPSKRKAKVPGFFINISALTRTPSPRRKFTTPTQNDSPRKAKPKNQKPAVKKLNLVELRRKFGTRFFKSYVKVRRFTDTTRMALPEEKKKSGKNLTVSFLETVEIFGESTDSEEWMDYDEGTPSPARASRLKPLENGDNSGPAQNVKSFSTSTPSADASPNVTGSFRKKGGILKRKEKISFSPLKEDESSPRKEQLKRSNEKIVRLSFEQQCADDDGQSETTAAERQHHADNVTPADAPSDDDKSEDDRNCSTEVIFSSSISPEKGPMTPNTTPPPSAEKDDSTEHENVPNPKQQETRVENMDSLEKDKRPTVDRSIVSEVSADTSGKDEESFESAEALTSNLEEKPNDEEERGMSEKLVLSDTEPEDIGSPAAEVSTESNRSGKEPADSEKELSQQQHQDNSGISEANRVNISNNSEQHFEDASDLVATVILNNSTEADRNEADAVLNDVCQIAAAESAALLDAADVAYNSRPNDDDDDDDFTSVLTHPEVERSLQAAASTLVPNSQEIVVAAAAVAASQVTDADDAEDTFASVVAEVERFTKDDNPGIYSDDVGITGADVMMDNVQASNSLDIFDDDDVDGQSHMFLHFPDDIISSLRMSSGNIDIGHDKSLPIQVIETEVMAIPNEPDLIFDKPLGTTASILGTSMSTTNDTLAGHGHCSTVDTNAKLSLGRIFQSVKSYVMSPGGDKNAALQD